MHEQEAGHLVAGAVEAAAAGLAIQASSSSKVLYGELEIVQVVRC